MNYSRILLLAGLVGLASCQPKTDSSLSTPADTSLPVATVNGTNISQNFFEQYIKAITGKASSELTAEQRGQALDNLIRAQVVGQQAAKDGVDTVPETAALIEMARLNVLHQALADMYLHARRPTGQDLIAD